MIEHFIKKEESLKRYKAFKARKLAYYSLFIIFLLTFLSFTAEIWANSKPLFLKYDDHFYFPVFKDYSAKNFGIEDSLTVNYKNLNLSENDFILWPLIKWDPFESNSKLESYPGKPTFENLMGTDDRGRDVLTRLLYGFRYSIIYSVLVWLITFFIGTILGGIQGFLGGRVDLYSQRAIEVLNTVPQFFLLIILISVFQPSLTLLVFISSLFGWISISYYIRAEFLKNRKREFVEAARAIGQSNTKIFFKHILPNSLAPLITFSPFVLAGNITALASLDYLGFGLTPPTPSWGELLSQAQKNFTIGWWLALYPSLALFSTLTMFSLIGEGVRDAMDPHKAKS